jgi:hypothetical protein
MDRNPWRALVLAAVALAACARGGTEAPSGAGLAKLVTSAPEGPSAACPRGGVKIGAGLDTNGNGVLERPEVTSISYECNGASGRPGLVTSASEPPGAHCEAGGVRIEKGADRNDDGELEPAEVTSASFVCNETDGAGHERYLRAHSQTSSRSPVATPPPKTTSRPRPES